MVAVQSEGLRHPPICLFYTLFSCPFKQANLKALKLWVNLSLDLKYHLIGNNLTHFFVGQSL
jgi:hypothetical protein